jgi:hypothetical protein
MPAPMATTPPADAPLPPRERLEHLRERYGALPYIGRLLLFYGTALLVGVFLVPLVLWVAGNRILGPYVHGQNLHAGPMALLGDFLTGLGHGSSIFWAVALGPAAFLLLLRLLLRLVRFLGGERDED